MSVGVIEVKNNKSTVRKLSKAERRTLIVLPNFCDANVTTDHEDPKVIEVTDINDFIHQFGEKNINGKSVLKKQVVYDDGEKELIEIEKMADFELEKLSGKSTVISKLQNSKKILNDLKKIKTTSFIDLIGNADKIDQLIQGLKEIKETIKQSTTK